MIEFVVLVIVAALVAAYIAVPRRGEHVIEGDEAAEALRARRALLLSELRELDEDLAAGRISADDRTAGRRALGPDLREVTEALRAIDGASARP